MATQQSYVIVGAGLAGAKAAETLRAEGFDGRIHLIGDEPERPYERPPLSKGVLLGDAERDSVFVHDEGWYAEHDVELRTGTAAVALHLSDHVVELAGGERLPFDKALLATGSSPRRLDVAGADLDGVYYLRRLGDSDALRSALAGGGRRVVVIGGGWIGLETAAASRVLGNEVTVVEPGPTVLRAALGDDLGARFAGLHREHGVRLLLGEGVASIEGAGGVVAAAVTTSGERLPADVVVVGVGARPNTALAEAAGLDVDNGIQVDASLRTSHPDVFAAGDVANAIHPLLARRLRVEHWANALHGGPLAARAMLGQDVVHDQVPFFYTDQYDVGMEYRGSVGPEGFDRLVHRGDPAGWELLVFWLKDSRVLAGMNVNVWDVGDQVEAMVRSGLAVDPVRLADPDVPLGSLLD